MAPVLFVGIDLAWNGLSSGLAVLSLSESTLTLVSKPECLVGEENILTWLERTVGNAPAMVSVDAPLIIANESGQRPVETSIGKTFGRYEASCHSSNTKRPFASVTSGFSKALYNLRFEHAPNIVPKQEGRFQIEVYPHPAMIRCFSLDKTIKYKKGRIASRVEELQRLRLLILSRLHLLEPALRIRPEQLPDVPSRGGPSFKCLEDELDAVFSAYIGAHWWYWGDLRNKSYGDLQNGYIIVPEPYGVE